MNSQRTPRGILNMGNNVLWNTYLNNHYLCCLIFLLYSFFPLSQTTFLKLLWAKDQAYSFFVFYWKPFELEAYKLVN